MTRSARQVLALLAKIGMTGLPAQISIHRTHAGRLQRSDGAWSWFALDESGREVIGSQWPVTEIVRKDKAEREVYLYTHPFTHIPSLWIKEGAGASER